MKKQSIAMGSRKFRKLKRDQMIATAALAGVVIVQRHATSAWYVTMPACPMTAAPSPVAFNHRWQAAEWALRMMNGDTDGAAKVYTKRTAPDKFVGRAAALRDDPYGQSFSRLSRQDKAAAPSTYVSWIEEGAELHAGFSRGGRDLSIWRSDRDRDHARDSGLARTRRGPNRSGSTIDHD